MEIQQIKGLGIQEPWHCDRLWSTVHGSGGIAPHILNISIRRRLPTIYWAWEWGYRFTYCKP